MDLRNFEPASMVAISGPMVNPAEDRPIMASIPVIAPLLPELTAAHENLVNKQMTMSGQASAMKVLVERALGLDATHDRLFRGVYNALSGIADLQPDEEKRSFVLQVRDTLFPSGLSGVLDAYLVESGNTALLEARVTPEIRDYLGKVIVDGRPMMDNLNDLIKVGEDLGKVERERARLGSTEDADAITKSDLLNARRRWIRIVQAMVQLLDIAPDITEDARNRILQPLLKEEARIAKKRSPSAAAADTEASAVEEMTEETAGDTDTEADVPTGTEA